MKIGVYVGSFNPFHLGHKEVVNYVLHNNLVDKVLIIPTGPYGDKKELVDINKRREMLEIYKSETIEIDYKLGVIDDTYIILKNIENSVLMMSSDLLTQIGEWTYYDELKEREIIIFKRKGHTLEDRFNLLKEDNVTLVNDYSPREISSTLVRECIKNNIPIDSYVDEEIKKYIYENNLYL